MSSTTTEVRLPTPSEFDAVKTALGTVTREVNRLGGDVHRFARSWDEELGVHPDTAPELEAIGRLWLFADALRDAGDKITANAQIVLEALPKLETSTR